MPIRFAGRVRAWRLVAGFSLLLAVTAAPAENHALIMWIGEYADAAANLPGLDNDARNARRIAAAMGVPDARITELKNRQLTRAGLSAALRDLTARIRQDDRVFVYYSGHGTQLPSRGGSAKACSEGIVAQDLLVYYDQNLVEDLRALGAKASQVVMLNDSCFSGGQATRQIELARGQSSRVPKFLPLKLGAGGDKAARQCGVAVNESVQPLTRNIEVVPTAGAQLLYVAAAAENEVSFATAQGSPATQAWADCLVSGDADIDRSGSISGEELRRCAQARLDRAQPEHQTISITGNAALPVTLGSAAAGAAPANDTVDAPRALSDLRAASDSAYRVVLRPAKPTLHIGQDLLEFTVETNRAGYLYVLQVGSDGKTFNLLFPNRMDLNNRIAAGVQRLPHDSWRMRSGGPEGVTQLLALVASVPKDFAGRMDASGTFAATPATRAATRNILLEATGALEGGQGRFGTSDLVQIREVR